MKILTVIYYIGITTIPVFWLIFAAGIQAIIIG
jgi:hypothetical protein